MYVVGQCSVACASLFVFHVSVSCVVLVSVWLFFMPLQEIDVDLVACEGEVIIMAISEHVENAGTHSGDATMVLPPQDLNEQTIQKIQSIAHAIAEALLVSGEECILFKEGLKSPRRGKE